MNAVKQWDTACYVFSTPRNNFFRLVGLNMHGVAVMFPFPWLYRLD
jgi:hypothetical protein